MERTPEAQALDHFSARAERYNASSHWCTDPELRDRTLSLLQLTGKEEVLDVACGTGLVSRWFHGKVKKVTGVDITPAMYEQAQPYLDDFREGPGEALPFPDASFDLVVCRQGIQFMEDSRALAEMARVLRPGGRVCLIHLCAYGEEDREAYYEILRLRNPSRRNFYLREDLRALLEGAQLTEVAVHDHHSLEDVDVWSDNGAIPEERREAIREVYRSASEEFRSLHAVQLGDRILDRMLFGIGIGTASP